MKRIIVARLGVAVLLLAMGLGVLAGWGRATAPRAAAETAGQTDLAIGIDLNGDSVNDCDTIVATGTPSTCAVAVGNTFGVREIVRSLAGMPDQNGNTIPEFGGMTWTLNYTAAGLTRVNSGSAQILAGACAPGSSPTSESSGATSFTCHGSASSVTGAVLRIDFTCSSLGVRTVTMKAMPNMSSLTWLHAEVTHAQTVSKDSDESLTINCVTSVGGVAELSGVAPSAAQTAARSGGGVSTGELAAIAGSGVLVVAAATWIGRRRLLARAR